MAGCGRPSSEALSRTRLRQEVATLNPRMRPSIVTDFLRPQETRG